MGLQDRDYWREKQRANDAAERGRSLKFAPIRSARVPPFVVKVLVWIAIAVALWGLLRVLRGH
jgi:hypothetical protein